MSNEVTQEEVAAYEGNPKLLHVRASDHKVYLASGVSVSVYEGRIEFDFFVDRPVPKEELMKPVSEGSSEFTPSGLMRIEPTREHLAIASISIPAAEGLIDILKQYVKN